MTSKTKQALNDKINEEIGNGTQFISERARRNLDILAHSREMDGDTRIRLLLEAYWYEAFEQGKISNRKERRILPLSNGDYCPECNTKIPDYARGCYDVFCWRCGIKLKRHWDKSINDIPVKEDKINLDKED